MVKQVIRFVSTTVVSLICVCALPASLRAHDATPAVVSSEGADEAAIRKWVDDWYGRQTPDPGDGAIEKMTIVYLRISGNKAIVCGDYGRALPGTNVLKQMHGRYVRLLVKEDGQWVNRDGAGFTY